MTLEEPDFLSVEEVLAIHRRQLERHGGGAGIRDRGLLESALAQPQMSLGGAFVHPGLFEMAAAYLFHLAKNHPFVDGNKRTALLTAASFLRLNGVKLPPGSEALYTLTMAVAEGRMDKEEVAAELERLAALT